MVSLDLVVLLGDGGVVRTADGRERLYGVSLLVEAADLPRRGHAKPVEVGQSVLHLRRSIPLRYLVPVEQVEVGTHQKQAYNQPRCGNEVRPVSGQVQSEPESGQAEDEDTSGEGQHHHCLNEHTPPRVDAGNPHSRKLCASIDQSAKFPV